jgi:hypothetical protein
MGIFCCIVIGIWLLVKLVFYAIVGIYGLFFYWPYVFIKALRETIREERARKPHR